MSISLPFVDAGLWRTANDKSSHQLVCSARGFCEKKVCARSKKDFGRLQSVRRINRPQMRVSEEHPVDRVANDQVPRTVIRGNSHLNHSQGTLRLWEWHDREETS